MVKNSIPKKKRKIDSTKIGLKNTLKRLSLIYHNHHTINITEEDEFLVHLSINLTAKQNDK